MSKTQYNLALNKREDVGKGASRRLRHKGLVPGIIYGGNKPPQQVVIPHNILAKQLEDEGFYANIVTLEVDGETSRALLKALQRHPFKPLVMHFDFQRITGNEILHRHVPLHFVNEDIAVGVKMGGGTIFHLLKDVEVACKASDLPEYIEVDVAKLEVGQSMHLSDLVLPAEVKLTAQALGPDHDLPVVNIQTTRAQIEEVASGSENSGNAAE